MLLCGGGKFDKMHIEHDRVGVAKFTTCEVHFVCFATGVRI